MANKELITCDYEGCDKPFAYMLGPFALCHTHLHEGEAKSWKERLLEQFKAIEARRNAKGNKGS